MELAWYLKLDWSMIWACLGAIALVSLAMAMQADRTVSEAKDKLAGVGNYFVPTWKNYAFQAIAGLVMLSFVAEIGIPVIDFIISKLNAVLGTDISFTIESSAEVAHTLAVLSGIGGGFILAKLIKLFQKF